MDNQPKTDKVLFSSRASLLFFWCLLMIPLIYAERFARYRYDYIFRGMLPWLMPLLIALFCALFAFLLIRWWRKGRPQEQQIFSTPFILYLLAAPLLALLFPYLVLNALGLNVFKLVTDLVLFSFFGYFAAYLLYYIVKPSMAALAVLVTLCGALTGFYFRFYFSASSPMLTTNEYHYLPAWSAALILGGILLALLLLWRLLPRFRALSRFRLSFLQTLLPPALSLIFLSLALFWLPGIVLSGLFFGQLALQILWLALFVALKKMK